MKIHNISKELINKAYTPDRINEYYNKAGKLFHYYQRISWIKRLSQPYERKHIAIQDEVEKLTLNKGGHFEGTDCAKCKELEYFYQTVTALIDKKYKTIIKFKATFDG
jgi:hypothetical protein